MSLTGQSNLRMKEVLMNPQERTSPFSFSNVRGAARGQCQDASRAYNIKGWIRRHVKREL
eukprot:scaffold191693_cov30-Prasinocladus_malaysianus.AAC.3